MRRAAEHISTMVRLQIGMSGSPSIRRFGVIRVTALPTGLFEMPIGWERIRTH